MNRRQFMTAAAGVSTVGLTALAGCTEETEESGSNDPVTPQTFTPEQTTTAGSQGDVEILEHEMYEDEYSFGVRGKLENKTDRELLYVEVQARFFDADETRIAEGLDNLSDLGPGTTANFDAVALEGESGNVANYEVEVTSVDF